MDLCMCVQTMCVMYVHQRGTHKDCCMSVHLCRTSVQRDCECARAWRPAASNLPSHTCCLPSWWSAFSTSSPSYQSARFTFHPYWQFLYSSWFSQLVLTSWICEEDGGDSGTHGGCPWQLDVRRRPRGGRSRGWRCSNGHTHTSPSILCSDWDCAWLPANPTMRASTPRAARALRAATILTTAAKAGLVASQLHNVPPLPLAHQVLTAAGLIARPTAWPRLTLRTLTNRKAGPAVSR